MASVVGSYQLGQCIGHGAFGKVYKCTAKDGSTYAVKEIRTSKLTNEKLVESLSREIQILKGITHPNIVSLIEVIKTNDATYMVMEYCNGGDFQDFLVKKKQVPEDECRQFLQQIATALEFMYKNNLIHRDLKPNNILLHVKDSKTTLKLADFGFARYLPEVSLANTHCGTPLYMAPEVHNGQYGYKADLWSVGVILFQMLYGKVPYVASSVVELQKKIQIPVEFPQTPQVSEPCKNLIRGLLRSDPTLRITFPEFFQDPFLSFQVDADLFSENRTIPGTLLSASEVRTPTFMREEQPWEPPSDPSAPHDVPQGAAEEFLVVTLNEAGYEAIADVLARSVDQGERSEALPDESLLTDAPPRNIGIEITSPETQSTLSSVISYMTSFWWRNPMTPEEECARALLSSFSSAMDSLPSEEGELLKEIKAALSRGGLLIELAAPLVDEGKTRPESLFRACALYLKALDVFRAGLRYALRYWEVKQQSISAEVNADAQALNSSLKRNAERVTELIQALDGTKFKHALGTPDLEQKKTIFTLAKRFEQHAERSFVIGDYENCNSDSWKAILLYQTLLSEASLKPKWLSPEDTEVIRNYLAQVKNLKEDSDRHS